MFDGLHKHFLDAIKFSSGISILDGYQFLYLWLETSFEHKVLSIPNGSPHIMKDVVGLLRTALRLLDAWERCHVCEHVQASLLLLVLDWANHHFVANEGMI
jgi:hypothetical protein